MLLSVEDRKLFAPTLANLVLENQEKINILLDNARSSLIQEFLEDAEDNREMKEAIHTIVEPLENEKRLIQLFLADPENNTNVIDIVLKRLKECRDIKILLAVPSIYWRFFSEETLEYMYDYVSTNNHPISTESKQLLKTLSER